MLLEKMSLLIYLVLQTGVLFYVDATATFEWKILKYDNPDGKDGNGNNCDFGSACDHYFRFGMDWMEGSTSDAQATPIVTKTTGVFDNSNSNTFQSDALNKGVYNPITYQFTTWTGGVLLKTYVMDDDVDADDYVDQIIFRASKPPDANVYVSTPKTESAGGSHTTLSFTWRVYCDEGFYGVDCSKLCRSADNSINGHYTCDSNGFKVCLQGWENPDNNCLNRADDCLDNQCMNNARCIDGIRSYTCDCKPGFTGLHCETNINECLGSPCKNDGTCVDGLNDYTCKCSPSFVGKNCSKTACTLSNPCLNGGTCYGETKCICPPNYVGEKCEDLLCKVVGCLNGGMCTINGTCFCLPGFVGSRCDIGLCDIVANFCRNGGMCREGKCQCPPGFSGIACEDNIVCVGYSCENGGMCRSVEDVASKKMAPVCQCSPGYSGPRCQEGPGTSNAGPQSGAINNSSSSSNPTSLFGILFIIFVATCGLLLLVVIILAVLLCRSRKRERIQKSRLASTLSTSSSVYSTVSEVFSHTIQDNLENCAKQTPVSPNVYDVFIDGKSFFEDEQDDFKKPNSRHEDDQENIKSNA